MRTSKDRKTAPKALQSPGTPSGYDDIISLPHHVSSCHPRMSMSNRAAQFSPFAALTGYGDVIQEAQRLTDRKPELTESQRAELDYKLQQILNQSASIDPGEMPLEKEAEADCKRNEKPTRAAAAVTVTITYFVPDLAKEGGACRTVQGQIRKIEEYSRKIILQDKTQIDIDCILDISVF